MSAGPSYAEGVTGTKDLSVAVPVWLLRSDASARALRLYMELVLLYGSGRLRLERGRLAVVLGTSKGQIYRWALELVAAGALVRDGSSTYILVTEARPEPRLARVGPRLGDEGGARGAAPARVGPRLDDAGTTNPQVSGAAADSVASLMSHGSSSHRELHDHERLIAEFAGRLGDELRHRFYGEDYNGRTTLGRLLAQAVAGGWRSSDLTEALARYIAAEQARKGVRVVTGAAITHMSSGRLGPPPIFAEGPPASASPKPPPDPLTEAFEEGRCLALLDPTAATLRCLADQPDPAILRARLAGARVDADAALAALDDIPDGEALFGALLGAAVGEERTVPA